MRTRELSRDLSRHIKEAEGMGMRASRFDVYSLRCEYGRCVAVTIGNSRVGRGCMAGKGYMAGYVTGDYGYVSEKGYILPKKLEADIAATLNRKGLKRV